MKKTIHRCASVSLVMGCILSWLRQQNGLDQQYMAQYLGITQASWSRIETGHATANIEQIINSCNAIGIEFVYVARLYTHIIYQLDKKCVDISIDSNARERASNEIREIVKMTIAEHALSVSV